MVIKKQTKKETRLLLVYGTLRKGFGLHYLIEEAKGKFVGIAEIEGYTMFANKSFPYVIKAEEGVVVGEIYEFTGDTETIKKIFRNFDFIESGYSREVIPSKLVGTKKEIDVECYIFTSPEYFKQDGIKLIESGDWREQKEKEKSQ